MFIARNSCINNNTMCCINKNTQRIESRVLSTGWPLKDWMILKKKQLSQTHDFLILHYYILFFFQTLQGTILYRFPFFLSIPFPKIRGSNSSFLRAWRLNFIEIAPFFVLLESRKRSKAREEEQTDDKGRLRKPRSLSLRRVVLVR